MADTPAVVPNTAKTPEELNPLLNPVLEQNLSRWAQVYFTTPPESRDRAVKELLRQLQVEMSSGSPPPAVPPRPSDTAASASVVCSSCRSENAPDQQFCGFCGTPLHARASAETGAPPAKDASPSIPALPRVETLSFLGLDSNEPSNAPGNAPGNELQFLREKSFSSDYYEREPDSHRGRYVVAIVAIILAGLIYIEWPSLRSHLQAGSRPSAAAPAPAGAGLDIQQPTLPEPQPPVSSENQPQAVAPPTSATPESEAKTSPENQPPAPSIQSAKPLTLASHTEAVTALPDGSQELVQAQRYLDGSGVAHDSRQAAVLLWKAVGKQNTRADILLADLYRLGDGVPKNCDQARLLLVAAAKKSAAGAADKLRNLESSGCP